MGLYSPATSAAFNGYYSKFRLPSGASLALIVSAVQAADPRTNSPLGVGKGRGGGQAARPYMVSITYVTKDGKAWWQREYWPERFDVSNRSSGGFTFEWDRGVFGWDPASTSSASSRHDRVWWKVREDDFEFTSETLASSNGSAASDAGRIPWRPGQPSSTPAGLIAYLPLPIQWHVHSVDSPCSFKLDILDRGAPKEVEPSEGVKGISGRVKDLDGPGMRTATSASISEHAEARVHVEKNWAMSFPTAYIWVQARDHERNKGICLAGGALVSGVDAYLVGYQGDTLPSGQQRFVSFKPPTSTSIFGLSLGLHSNVSFKDGLFELTINGWFTRLRVKAVAPADTFFPFPAPLAKGHSIGYTTQSFAAKIEVVVEERSAMWPFGSWHEVERSAFEGGSLEFGGDFYKSKCD